MKFTGSKNYVATQDLMLSVNAASTLQSPLLVKGEPGTGKTMLARAFSGLLPDLNLDEVLEITGIHSVAAGGSVAIDASQSFDEDQHDVTTSTR
jgi:predicted ATPase with chaperone activity